MTRPALIQAELDLIVLLCEFALEDEHIPPSMRNPGFHEFTREDFGRLRVLIEKLATDEPREYRHATAEDPPDTYTPAGGRL